MNVKAQFLEGFLRLKILVLSCDLLGGDFFGKSKSHISPRLVFILRGRSTQRTEQEQQLCRSFVRVWLGNTCNAQTDPEFSFLMLC